MNPFFRRRFLLALLATFLFAGTARGELMFPVNNPGSGNWVFDQPSVSAQGWYLHLAFIGDPTGSGQYKIYYSLLDGSADFRNASTTRSTVVKVSPVVIDNGSLYTSARHPQVVHRQLTNNSTGMVILFQAIPPGGSEYKLFRALLVGVNGVLQSQQVSEIVFPGNIRMSGNLVDPSVAVVDTDNYLRIAYADNTTGNVYYARVGIDNATLAGTPILLSRSPESRGVQPLPRLRLDPSNRSHVAWAANNATPFPSGIYYAMINAYPTVDNLAIGATQVLWGFHRWGFPTVLAPYTNRIGVFAVDEPYGMTGTAGSLGLSVLDPDQVSPLDGNPVGITNISSDSYFLVNPPGGSVLSPDFDTYRPETAIDGQNRVHVAGYGFRYALPGTPTLYLGTPGSYYAMSLGWYSYYGTYGGFASMVASPVPVGNGSIALATSIEGDYTRPAFVHYNGRSVQFWSGPDNVVDGARNLYVTGAFDSPDNAPSSQSGCAMVGDPRRGEAERIPAAVALFLPAALIGLRKIARKGIAR